MSGNNDLVVVAVALVFAATYGVFMFFYAAQPSAAVEAPKTPGQNYTTPDSGDFFDTLTAAWNLTVSQPEIFFVNTVIFAVIAMLLVFVFLRYLRGS